MNLAITNILDESSNIIYDYEYDVKYITDTGLFVDYNYYIENKTTTFKMAFVGCTYCCS
jgi:hypothetical protein